MEQEVTQSPNTFAIPKKNEQDNKNKRIIVFSLISVFVLATAVFVIMQIYWYVANCTNATAKTWTNHKIQSCAVLVQVRKDVDSVEGTAKEVSEWVPIKDAHVASFEEVNESYGKDKNSVYFLAQVIPSASSTTFALLDGFYARDHKSVFWTNHLVQGASPQEFTVLEQFNDLGSENDALYYRNQKAQSAERIHSISLTSPSETYPLTLHEPTLIQWKAATDTYPFVLIRLEGRNESRWLTQQPYQNTGAFVFSLDDESIEDGEYALRVLLLSDEGEMPYYLLNKKAYALENPWVKFAINGEHPDLPNQRIHTRPGESLKLTWETSGVRDCMVLLESSQYIAVEDGVNSKTVQVKDRGTNFNGTSYGVTCTSYGGREVSDYVGVNVYGLGFRDPLLFTLLTPNGGEIFQAGDSVTITWDGVDPTTSVDLKLSTNQEYQPVEAMHNKHVLFIAPKTPNTGSYTWTIPPGVSPGADYFIQVGCVNNRDIHCIPDQSDTSFSIGLSGTEALEQMKKRKELAVDDSGNFTNRQWYALNKNLFSDGHAVYVDAGLGKLGTLPSHLASPVQPQDINVVDDLVVTVQGNPSAWYHHCYSSGDCALIPIYKSESESFKKIGNQYYKDADTVFVLFVSQFDPGQTTLTFIPSADPNTLVPIEGHFSKDAFHVYYGTTIIQGADPVSFSPVDTLVWDRATSFKDAYRTYKKIPVTMKRDSFEPAYNIVPSQ